MQEHGTHVAGTIACNFDTPATVDGAAIPFGISGVAPRALLGSYNIFPGNIEDARSEDILNALEAAYRDGMDIVNMSLGGGAHGVQDLLTVAVDNLDQANMISAVAAGDSGPGRLHGESPGSAARALTAGASSVNHAVTNPVTAGAASAAGVLGDFGKPSYPFGGTLCVLAGDGVSGLSLACDPLAAAASADSIALIQRGVCDFSLKLYNVQQAGYAAAIVVNRIDGPPIAMGKGVAPTDPTIPGWMIGLDAAVSFKAQDGAAVLIGAGSYTYPFYDADVMADFSSEGPTDVDFRVKPDVVAPGVNVLSSIPTSFCDGDPCFAFFQGTSMATPHLAGSAAIVRQEHPDWPAWAVGSAVVNTADTGVLREVHARRAGDQRQPVGRRAAQPRVRRRCHGRPRPGQRQLRCRALRVRLHADGDRPDPEHHRGAGRLVVGIAPNGGASGVTFSTSVSSVSLTAGASTTFTVRRRSPRRPRPAASRPGWPSVVAPSPMRRCSPS